MKEFVMSERVAVHQGEHIETLELKKKKKEFWTRRAIFLGS